MHSLHQVSHFLMFLYHIPVTFSCDILACCLTDFVVCRVCIAVKICMVLWIIPKGWGFKYDIVQASMCTEYAEELNQYYREECIEDCFLLLYDIVVLLVSANV